MSLKFFRGQWVNSCDWLVQERRNSSVLAMELSLSCAKPSTYLFCQSTRRIESWCMVKHQMVILVSIFNACGPFPKILIVSRICEKFSTQIKTAHMYFEQENNFKWWFDKISLMLFSKQLRTSILIASCFVQSSMTPSSHMPSRTGGSLNRCLKAWRGILITWSCASTWETCWPAETTTQSLLRSYKIGEKSTHVPLDKMAAMSQTIFSDAFSWMKSFVFWLKFHWSLFLRVQLTITHHWFK